MELFINEKLNQLLEIDYDVMPDNPLDMEVDDSVKFFIGNVIANLTDQLFNGDNEAYQVEHDKYTNVSGLFQGLDKIAKKQGKLIFPITKYEHSEVRYYLGTDQGWDRCVAGFALVDLKQLKQNYGINSKTKIKGYLDNWLDDYTNYVNGYVYLATTYQLNSKHEIDHEIDHLGNLLPDDANVEHLFDLWLLEGNLEDWKKATTKVTTSYILA